jgi:hypothetical protein
LSRSSLLPFLVGVGCGVGLALAGSLLLDPARDSAPQVAAPSPDGAPAELVAALESLRAAQASRAPEPLPSVDPAPTNEAEPEDGPMSLVVATALLQEAQERAKRVRDALENLPGGDDAPIAYQLEAYQKALADSFGNIPIPDGADKKDLTLEAFLWTDSVQKQLASMDATTRQGEVNFIRRELGYTDAEVQELARRDAEREARWTNGLSYTKERHRAAGSLEGEVLRKELDRLRQKYFGQEAATIAAEERDGFFRFERPRIYGRN